MPTWDDVLALDGFSSAKNRLILNRVVKAAGNARILEVGSFLGSTAVAMCYENDVTCIHCVDNHSEFGDTRQRFAEIASRFNLPAIGHDLDYFSPLPADVFGGTRFNVYHYDGPHDEEQHATELSIAWPHLSDSFVYIVDDYSWEKVRAGCEAGLAAMSDRMTVRFREQYASFITNDRDGHWNGMLVAWCEKKP